MLPTSIPGCCPRASLSAARSGAGPRQPSPGQRLQPHGEAKPAGERQIYPSLPLPGDKPKRKRVIWKPPSQAAKERACRASASARMPAKRAAALGPASPGQIDGASQPSRNEPGFPPRFPRQFAFLGEGQLLISSLQVFESVPAGRSGWRRAARRERLCMALRALYLRFILECKHLAEYLPCTCKAAAITPPPSAHGVAGAPQPPPF